MIHMDNMGRIFQIVLQVFCFFYFKMPNATSKFVPDSTHKSKQRHVFISF